MTVQTSPLSSPTKSDVRKLTTRTCSLKPHAALHLRPCTSSPRKHPKHSSTCRHAHVGFTVTCHSQTALLRPWDKCVLEVWSLMDRKSSSFNLHWVVLGEDIFIVFFFLLLTFEGFIFHWCLNSQKNTHLLVLVAADRAELWLVGFRFRSLVLVYVDFLFNQPQLIMSLG